MEFLVPYFNLNQSWLLQAFGGNKPTHADKFSDSQSHTSNTDTDRVNLWGHEEVKDVGPPTCSVFFFPQLTPVANPSGQNEREAMTGKREG